MKSRKHPHPPLTPLLKHRECLCAPGGVTLAQTSNTKFWSTQIWITLIGCNTSQISSKKWICYRLFHQLAKNIHCKMTLLPPPWTRHAVTRTINLHFLDELIEAWLTEGELEDDNYSGEKNNGGDLCWRNMFGWAKSPEKPVRKLGLGLDILRTTQTQQQKITWCNHSQNSWSHTNLAAKWIATATLPPTPLSISRSNYTLWWCRDKLGWPRASSRMKAGMANRRVQARNGYRKSAPPQWGRGTHGSSGVHLLGR